MILRIVESIGLGCVAACGVGLIIVPILLYRGEPANALIFTLLSVGGICGLVWGIYRRPSALTAAIEADRQLDWADLLASAWCVSRRPSDAAFSAAVLSLAEQKCAATSPSRIILNRLGARAWGGIGLATALLLTLGLISVNPMESQAASEELSPARRPLSARLLPQAGPPGVDASDAPPASAFPHDQDHSDERPLDPHQNQSQASSTESGKNHSDNSAANPNGVGAGSGRTNQADAGHTATPAATDSQRNNATGNAGGGVGQSATGQGAKGSSGASASEVAAHRDVPPWQSNRWPEAQSQALHAVESGEVPAAYQELVRQYFSR